MQDPAHLTYEIALHHGSCILHPFEMIYQIILVQYGISQDTTNP
jgi:hypothetical protein